MVQVSFFFFLDSRANFPDQVSCSGRIVVGAVTQEIAKANSYVILSLSDDLRRISSEENLTLDDLLKLSEGCVKEVRPLHRPVTYRAVLRQVPSSRSLKTVVSCVNEDLLLCAKKSSLNGKKKVLVISAADAKFPGGRWKNGAKGQEEDLFRR